MRVSGLLAMVRLLGFALSMNSFPTATQGKFQEPTQRKFQEPTHKFQGSSNGQITSPNAEGVAGACYSSTSADMAIGFMPGVKCQCHFGPALLVRSLLGGAHDQVVFILADQCGRRGIAIGLRPRRHKSAKINKNNNLRT